MFSFRPQRTTLKCAEAAHERNPASTPGLFSDSWRKVC
jgi:hypothetical protein